MKGASSHHQEVLRRRKRRPHNLPVPVSNAISSSTLFIHIPIARRLRPNSSQFPDPGLLLGVELRQRQLFGVEVRAGLAQEEDVVGQAGAGG